MAKLLPICQSEVGSKYCLGLKLGEGAYGIVCSAYDKESQRVVAIKRIKPSGNINVLLRTLREVKILKHFKTNRHKNIIRLLEAIKPSSMECMKNVYLVFEKMDSDLFMAIRLQHLSNEHVRYFLFQIVSGVHYLHSCNIIHRDLKPSNILVNSNCELKIADFGLSRTVHSETVKFSPVFFNGNQIHRKYTEYVATRWYRAPEIIYSSGNYSKSIDMWSIGCILAEMILGKPLFPGTSHNHQLKLILSLLGPLNEAELQLLSGSKFRKVLESEPIEKIEWQSYYDSVAGLYDTLAWDLMKKLLSFDPKDRPSAHEVLSHSYLSHFSFKESSSETSYRLDLSYLDDYSNFSYDLLKGMVWNEINSL